MREEWRGFSGTKWLDEVNMREFIQANYTGYDGDAEFLADPTEATNKLWGKLKELQKEERAKGGVLDMETEIVSSATAYGAGYIDESMKDLEVSRWQSRLVLHTATNLLKNSTKSSQNIARPTTKVCSMHTQTR